MEIDIKCQCKCGCENLADQVIYYGSKDYGDPKTTYYCNSCGNQQVLTASDIRYTLNQWLHIKVQQSQSPAPSPDTDPGFLSRLDAAATLVSMFPAGAIDVQVLPDGTIRLTKRKDGA